MDESALRNQLNNLAARHSSLHSWFRFWEWVVVAGIVFEFVVLAVEYWDEWTKFKLAIIRSPEKPNIWLYAVGFLGVAMVAGGITGELKIDSRIEGIETQVRAVNEQLFGIVSKEASDAVTSAHNADIAAGNAQAKANAADKSAGKAHQEIDAALKQLTELQARIAWRSISDEQKKTLKDALRPFHGRTISLTWDGVDPEQNSFGLQLRVALHDAGLNVRLDISGLSILGPPENAVTGILIEGNDPTFIKGLAKALVSASLVRGPIPVFPMNTSDGNPEIRIRPKAP